MGLGSSSIRIHVFNCCDVDALTRKAIELSPDECSFETMSNFETLSLMTLGVGEPDEICAPCFPPNPLLCYHRSMSRRRTSIRRGTAYLDRHYPHWESSIDIDALDLSDIERCVLGQLEGDYFIGLKVLDARGIEVSSRDLGFTVGDLSVAMDDVEEQRMWADLTNRWRAAIRRRLGRSGR